MPPRPTTPSRPRRSRRLRTRRTVRAIDAHVPVRSCLGCRRRRPQSDLVRITRAIGDGGSPVFAVDGPSSGRGAWLCRADDGLQVVVSACLDRALSQRRFGRAWRVRLDRDDDEAIRAALRRDERPAG